MKATHSFARAAAILAVALTSLAGCGGEAGDSERLATAAETVTSKGGAAQQHAKEAPAPRNALDQRDAAEASQVEQPPSALETSDLGRRVAALRSEVAQLRQQVSALESALGVSGRESKVVADLESRFRGEAVISQWSQIARAQVNAAFSRITTEPEAADALRTIECRASMCKVETTPEADETVNESLGIIFSELRGTFSKVFAVPVAESEGRPASVIYFSR